MARVTETFATINSLIRTLLAVAVLGGGGYAGWRAYEAYHADSAQLAQTQLQLTSTRSQLQSLEAQLKEKDGLLSTKDESIQQLTEGLAEKDAQLIEKEKNIGKLNRQLEAGQRRIDQLETAMHLLKVDHRLAQITVLDQTEDADSKKMRSKIQFVEINDDGAPIDQPRTFDIEGDLLYVDFWIVKFDEKYVEQADMLRSTSICLFRRIFGEYQNPNDGYGLDRVGSRPHAYARGGQPTDFEQAIWKDFWNIANDPVKASEMGIRAAHGEAVAARLRKGKKYRVLLRASGGLSITPVVEPSAAADQSDA